MLQAAWLGNHCKESEVIVSIGLLNLERHEKPLFHNLREKEL